MKRKLIKKAFFLYKTGAISGAEFIDRIVAIIFRYERIKSEN